MNRHILQMYARDAVPERFQPYAYIRTGRLHPVGVERDAEFVGGEILQQVLDDPLAVRQLLPFKVVVVVHQFFACGGDAPGRLLEICCKMWQPECTAVFFRHRADANIIAPENVVLPDDRIGVVQDACRVGVGQYHPQPVFLADRP